jgi:hypothetical protein
MITEIRQNPGIVIESSESRRKLHNQEQEKCVSENMRSSQQRYYFNVDLMLPCLILFTKEQKSCQTQFEQVDDKNFLNF